MFKPCKINNEACKSVLALDIGNSNTVFGLFTDGELSFIARSATDKKRTADDIAVSLMGFFKINNKNICDLTGSVISSVVPQASDAIIKAIEHLTGKTPLLVSSKTSRVKMNVDNPESIGTDRIANVVASVCKYEKPTIILDLGTATTINVVDNDGVFIGGSILPGVMTSLDALSGTAAQLPNIENIDPGPVIAKNTLDCMRAGIVYGTASMLDGIIERMEEELGVNAVITATGGLAQKIIKYCKKHIIYDPNLLLEGLYRIYMLNLNDGSENGEL